MDLKKVRNKKITATRKIVYASYHQELYKKCCSCLTGQHEILYHRIREKSLLPADRDAVLYIIEMFRFTERSEELICHVKKRCHVPVLFISCAQAEKTRKEEALRAVQCGADRYLSGHHCIEEMIAEVVALIRIQERVKKRPEVWEYKEVKLVPDRRQVFFGEREVILTRLEFDIVCYLAMQNGRAVTYRELFEAAWHNEYLFDDTNITVHIHRIRRKLEKDIRNPYYIQNVYGVGYRFGCCCTRKTVLEG